MKHTFTFRVLTLVSAMVLLGGLSNVGAQTRGEVTGVATGQIRKVEKSVTASKPTDYNINAGRGEQAAEWVRVAEQTKKFTPKFQWGVKAGISALAIKNSAEADSKGVGGKHFSIQNSCKYYYSDTPRSERQSRLSWNASAFGRYNFGMGNLQAEINYNENRYETVLVNQTWSPDKRIMTGTIYDRSIDIPVVLGWKYSFFRFYFGPQFKVWTKYNTVNEGTYDYKDPSLNKQVITLPVNVKHYGFDPNRADEVIDLCGFQRIEVDHSIVHVAMGMSFEFSNVVIDARYVTPFKRPTQNFYSFNNSDPTSYRIYMHTFQIAVGVMF